MANSISCMNAVRIFWSILALACLAGVILYCSIWGWPATALAVVIGLLPDIALIGAFATGGRLKPERVRFYNALHSISPAVTLFAAGLLVLACTGGRDSQFWAASLAGLAWLTHIAADRTFGYGKRSADGTIIAVGRAGV